MKRRTGMEEEKDSYRMCMNEYVCVHEWEKRAPHPTWPSPGTLVRDIMSIPECRLHCCSWLTQTPLPFLLCFWLSNSFCFVFTNNKRDARVSSRQETSFLPPYTTWMGRSHKRGGSHRITLPRSPSHIHTHSTTTTMPSFIRGSHRHHSLCYSNISLCWHQIPKRTVVVYLQIWLDIRYWMSVLWLRILVYYYILMTYLFL